MNVIKYDSPNFSSREGRKIIAIVDHITAGAFPGCRDWMCNPASQASAHYLVTRAGVIYQLVADAAKAWHAGVVDHCIWNLYDGSNPNLYTLGIEHEGQPDTPLTESQYQSTLWLHKQLIAKWGIPIDVNHIIPHSCINAGHNCPGPAFPWLRLLTDLKAAEGGTDEVKTIVLLYSDNDYWAGVDVAARNGQCPIVVRPANRSVPPVAMNCEHLITIGGPKAGHKNETYLSGQTKYDTAAAVAKYLGY